ncbi:MAG: phage holin family protein [Candidatus Magasanikbacteria bacterium]
MRTLFIWFLNAGALLLIASYLPGMALGGIYAALITVLVLGLVNALIRPIVFVLSLPVNILTLGLFTFVINAMLFWFVSTIVKGFAVNSFGTAFLASILFSILSFCISVLLKKQV